MSPPKPQPHPGPDWSLMSVVAMLALAVGALLGYLLGSMK